MTAEDRKEKDTVGTILAAVEHLSLDTLGHLIHDAENRPEFIHSVGEERAAFLARELRGEVDRRVKSMSSDASKKESG